MCCCALMPVHKLLAQNLLPLDACAQNCFNRSCYSPVVVRFASSPATAAETQAMLHTVHRWMDSLHAPDHPLEDLVHPDAHLIDNTNQACYAGYRAMKHRMQVGAGACCRGVLRDSIVGHAGEGGCVVFGCKQVRQLPCKAQTHLTGVHSPPASPPQGALLLLHG